MIVQKDDGGGGFLHRHREHLPWMHDAKRQAAFGYGGIAQNRMLGV
jgi:hypothetical protein